MNGRIRIAIALASVTALAGASASMASAASVHRIGPVNVHPVVSTVAAIQIQGGSTGNKGSLSESQCEQLGNKANDAANKGLEEAKNGDMTAGQADGAASQ